ncbi:MAG TPA: sulfite exporter TauE/SafE family protein [Methylomirabilota bacterium]|nr:sulfite exporter TauE/SafE family protein [Methylomirabilota bacterium]
MLNDADSAPEAHSPAMPTALVGLLAGFASGFLGIGGGLVLVPLLSILLRCPIKRALGTSLTAILFIGLAGLAAEWEVSGDNTRWVWALFLSLGSVVGSALGARLVLRIADRPLRLALALVLIVASLGMARLLPSGAELGTTLALVGGAPGQLVMVAVGVLAGLTSALFGLGGGIATVPALALFCSDLPFGAIRATSLAAVVMAATLDARQHARLGHVDPGLVRLLLPGGLAGAVLGVIAANGLPVALCRTVLAALLVLIALRLMLPAWQKSTTLSGWAGRTRGQAGQLRRQP